MKHSDPKARVVVSKDGPYLVVGSVPLAEQIIATDTEGVLRSLETRRGI